MPQKFIIVKGAREHNLKNINVAIPREKFVVITGVSGSGKSSLVFDTIYAEGQRRYLESLSTYARQFLGKMEKPNVESIEGLSPAIAIQQTAGRHNPRSTVGTVTEIYDYLRILYARIGEPHCYKCGRKLEKTTVDEVVDRILKLPPRTRIVILSPLTRDKKGEHRELIEKMIREGFERFRIDGEIYTSEETPHLEKNKKHTIEVVVDRISIREGIKSRLADSVETAFRFGDGMMTVIVYDTGEELFFSENYTCPVCGISYGKIEPRMFSFNSPYGACEECGGLGEKLKVAEDLVVPNPELSLVEGAVKAITHKQKHWFWPVMRGLARKYHFSLTTPFKDLPDEVKKVILYGDTSPVRLEEHTRKGYWTHQTVWEGVIPSLERRFNEYDSEEFRNWAMRFMRAEVCPVCKGKRLKKESLSVFVNGKSIADLVEVPSEKLIPFFETLTQNIKGNEKLIAEPIVSEILKRLKFLKDIGVGYISLGRKISTLSGGELQRIRLATQLGSALTGVLYVLDEPTIGLHPRDTSRLIKTLKHLRDLGNTVIVVEHDEETIRSADHIVDLGPRAGELGGEVVAVGTVEDIVNSPKSITGKYLKGELKVEVSGERRKGNGKFLKVIGAKEHNLKNITVEFPLETFTVVTGVSGSGKSSLVMDILYKGLKAKLYRSKEKVGDHDDIAGFENIDRVVEVDQSPIGRTPRSNPATYTDVFKPIRELFARLPESKVRGYTLSRFSFNLKGGRCEACKGEGFVKVEMHFLPDVFLPCEVCKGKRYNAETLEVKYKGKNIADVLEMSVDSAMKFFENIPQIIKKLKVLSDVGLGYIKLGQPATTLSGGEAQRIKLAKELQTRSGRTLYILDEPTVGLHFDDVKKLVDVLHRLVDAGNTVIVIEHNLDVIKTADFVIDLGPEGGDEGGYVVATGTPEEIAKCEKSWTGKWLRKVL